MAFAEAASAAVEGDARGMGSARGTAGASVYTGQHHRTRPVNFMTRTKILMGIQETQRISNRR